MKKKSSPKQALAPWNPADKEDFRQWLREDLAFQPPASNDVCSRLKRLSGLCDMGLLKSEDDVESLFSTRTVIGDDITIGVRSQMKRAAKLYLQFRGTKRRKQSR